ncbi:GNAT family N-acetyltransferase [Bacillus sp. B-jedd]|uniref:GNAT family N-acetyltransferase n=1 Tax=Bacillus sp. B-jedd TaxID=1476857 RepID=UPI000515634A|nr:GNAT family N-acetyltransferase [Bacillus sp. B-jedd]CEG26210.1 acetyl-transferase [Bacillus sp. B-jedd]
MINYKEIDKSYFEQYDTIPMLVHVKSILALKKIENGLGGILLEETPVKEYIKDLGSYAKATEYAAEFDITNWGFFMAFDGEKPIAAATIVAKPKDIRLVDGREDLCLLWDLRVDDCYKQQGVGTTLLNMSVEWSRSKGYQQMKIECQNNNVQACKFYKKQGAVLGKVDEYAYYTEAAVKNEVQLVWYLNL